MISQQLIGLFAPSGTPKEIIEQIAQTTRTATKWAPGGPTVRLHIGLEDVDDLIGDLERGFAAFAAAR